MSARKRCSAVLDALEGDDSGDLVDADASADYAPFPPPAKKARAPPKPKKPAAVAVSLGKCGMTHKQLGDAIKEGLRTIEKYDAQRTMVSTTMDATFFRSFFNLPGVRISPPQFDETTPVVVADMGFSTAGQVFGVSKVKGGNRMITNHVARVVAILYPADEKFTMMFSI